jgi:MSHA pilin protein MshD
MSKYKGFTLIELVVGIVAFSIVLTITANLVIPHAQRSAQPIFQVRATELAQSLINEITAKAFDHNSDFNGGTLRCGESGALTCTLPDNLGPDILASGDSETRAQFNDVDDYNGLVLGLENAITNSLGEVVLDPTMTNLYNGFQVSIDVFYDSNFDGTDDANISPQKAIEVTVTPPNSSSLVFTTYRSNF